MPGRRAPDPGKGSGERDPEAPTSRVPPAGGPAPTGKRPSRIVGFIAFLAWLGALSVFLSGTIMTGNPADFLGPATIATALYFGFSAWRLGALLEILSLGRFFGGLALGYLFGGEVAARCGFSGLLGHVFGFYATFFTVYLIGALLMSRFDAEKHPPSGTMRALGFLIGAVEGTLMCGVLTYALAFLPGKGPDLTQLPAARFVEQVVAPLIPAQSSGVVDLVKLAGEVKGGIDPERVDRETLQTQFRPVFENAKLRSLAEDPEIQELSRRGETARMLQHPKVWALLSDPEMEKLATQVDWQAVAKAIRQGLKK